MILFLEDYKYYPRAIVDYQTSNRSFVELAKLYRDMGIKNNVFHLTLLNPELQGIDPHRTDLPVDIQVAIALEVKMNPWYYLREVARAPARSTQVPPPVRANRSIISLFWSFLNNAMFMLIQPRQTGKSLGADLLSVWLMGFRCDNTEMNLLTKDDQLRRNNIQRMKDLMSDLPPYLQLRGKIDVNNGEEITIKRLGNIYKTHVPQASPKRAYNLGRGLTTAIFQCDEGPFCPNIEISLPAALASMGDAAAQARRNNAPNGVIMTTTAGKRDDKDGKYVFNLLQEAAVWNEKYFDCLNREDLEIQVRKDSRIDKSKAPNGVYRINATFSHRQLGYDDEWLQKRLEESLATGDDANRDFFNVWTAGNETSPFPPDVAEAIAQSRSEPVATSISDTGMFITKWYVPEEDIQRIMDTRPVIMSIDASENIGRDDTTVHYLDLYTMKTLGTGKYNNVNVYTLSEFILNQALKYPKILINIEAKNMGIAIINYLCLKLPLNGQDPFKRMFNRIVQESDDVARQEMFKEIQRYGRQPDVINKYRNFFGFPTSGGGAYSRDSLYGNVFKVALSKAKDKVLDIDLADQLLTLVIRNGRIDHEVGCHDDMVIAWLLNFWIAVNGKNLAYYGIDSSNFMKEEEVQRPISEDEYYELLEQNAIRQEMINVYQLLEDEEDEFVIAKLEQRLRTLNKKIILREHETYSIDVLIDNVRKKRKESRRLNQYAQQTSNIMGTNHYYR